MARKLRSHYAPINVKLQHKEGRGEGEGREERRQGADPDEFDTFIEVRVQFPMPKRLLNVKFPPHKESKRSHEK